MSDPLSGVLVEPDYEADVLSVADPEVGVEVVPDPLLVESVPDPVVVVVDPDPLPVVPVVPSFVVVTVPDDPPLFVSSAFLSSSVNFLYYLKLRLSCVKSFKFND